jgi:hypothetical protein
LQHRPGILHSIEEIGEAQSCSGYGESLTSTTNSRITLSERQLSS